MNCCVKDCNEPDSAWIDIIDDTNPKTKGRDREFGRFPFCKKHFDIIMPYVKQKEEELPLKDGKFKCFWLFAPISIVEEALKKREH